MSVVISAWLGKRLIGLGLVLLAVFLVANLWAWNVRRWHDLQQAAEAGQHQADLRQKERQAQSEISLSQRSLQEQSIVARDLTETAITQARREEDAQISLGDSRNMRLSDHDRWLCGQNPRLRGCSTRASSAAGD